MAHNMDASRIGRDVAEPGSAARSKERSAPQRVIVGQVAGAHGIGGEVRVRVLTDDAALLLGAKRFALSRSGPEDPQATEIENQGGTTGRPGEVRLTLRGVADRDAAEALRGTLLLADVADLPLLPDGGHYWHELVGCVVETAAGERVGTVSGLLDTGAAHDVLQVAGDDGKPRLIPMVGALLRSVDVANRRIVLEDIAGLADPA
jgi:16S rRNA processing protein RimM